MSNGLDKAITIAARYSVLKSHVSSNPGTPQGVYHEEMMATTAAEDARRKKILLESLKTAMSEGPESLAALIAQKRVEYGREGASVLKVLNTLNFVAGSYVVSEDLPFPWLPSLIEEAAIGDPKSEIDYAALEQAVKERLQVLHGVTIEETGDLE